MESNQDYVYYLAASPTYEQDGLFFAAKQSGLYRSKDGGQTWEDAFASLNLTAPLATTYVALAEAQDEILFVFACVEGNVLRSMDSGENWEFAELSSPAPLVTSLVASRDFAQDGLLVAGTIQDGIFRSSNRGVTWSSWNFGLFDANINTLAISPLADGTQTIFAGTQSGIFCSINAGRSWRDLDFPIDFAPVLSLAIHPDGGIFAAGENEGLFISTDGGKKWQQSLPDPVGQIVCHHDGKLLVLTDSNIQVSGDGGTSWQIHGEIDSEISCLAAPKGLNAGDPIWMGLSDGRVSKLS